MILVTGATGTIGSELVPLLARRVAVRGMTRRPCFPGAVYGDLDRPDVNDLVPLGPRDAAVDQRRQPQHDEDDPKDAHAPCQSKRLAIGDCGFGRIPDTGAGGPR